MKNFKSFILIIATVVLFNSCTKDGPTGPQGAAGNANVNSYTFSTDSNSWQGTNRTGWLYRYTNSSMNLNGGVEVYWGNISTNQWSIIPTFNYIEFITVGVYPNSSSVLISFNPLDSPSVPVNNPGVQQFQIVTIPKL
jgi:hypothetical protein